MNVRLIDTHTHLHSTQFKRDLAAVLERAAAAGVERMVEVGYDLESSKAAVALAQTYPHIYAVVGVQPNYVHKSPPNWLDEVRRLAEHPKVVAIGEIGLDYYHDYAPHDVQEQFFVEQLAFARERKLPVVIHSREAPDDTLRVLRQHAVGVGGIMHSFSGDWNHARGCLDVGFSLSISGPVTFSSARDLHMVARRMPRDRILTETDCPYLTPHPFRGKRNEPAHVRLVAEQIASLRGVPLEKLAEDVWNNAARVFGW